MRIYVINWAYEPDYIFELEDHAAPAFSHVVVAKADKQHDYALEGALESAKKQAEEFYTGQGGWGEKPIKLRWEIGEWIYQDGFKPSRDFLLYDDNLRKSPICIMSVVEAETFNELAH